MANKTDRIVSYLPSTFRKQPRGVTLHAVVDAYGRELQDAENTLAEVTQSHWVDYADRLQPRIDDLARIAALYGLGPRPDETVEAFREHLKRYIRTYLDGTVTVQGVLRIAAQALGLDIADDYETLDTWWARPEGDAIAVAAPDGRDAAELVLGARAAFNRGLSSLPAQVRGTADLTSGADCRESRWLRLVVDGAGPFEIDVSAGAADLSAVPGQLIADNINAEIEQPIARFDGRALTLTSPRRGFASVIEVRDILNDAAEAVLGLPPRAYNGRDESPARVRGLVDLSGVLDLSEARYLRVLIDGARLAEIDVAGPDPAGTLLHQVVERLNAVLGEGTVTADDQFLTLTSPTAGLGSSIVFQQAAAQQALLRLFGPISRTHLGRGTLSAQVIGRRDLSGGVDLSRRSRLLLRVDGAEHAIDCAGRVPENTQLPELVAAINDALGARVATHSGGKITLTSTASGLSSEIVFLTPAEEDATELLFGIRPRVFHGRAAAAGRVLGTPDLSQGVDLRSRYRLRLRLDGRPPVIVDLRTHADPANLSAVSPQQLADAIDAQMGADIASTDGARLNLVSRSEGSASSIEVAPLATSQTERFITRAFVTGEAADALFGFNRQTATGAAAANARVKGGVDVHRGVDLRQNRYLRLAIDDRPAVEIDVAGVRPRATLIDELVNAINLGIAQAGTPVVATFADGHLILTSPTAGAAGRLALGSAGSGDALSRLLGLPPGETRGQDAEPARLVGTVDLSAGIDLSAGDRIKLGIDGAAPVEIACAEGAADPTHVRLGTIRSAINRALRRKLAGHDGKFLSVTSRRKGGGSRIIFDSPDTGDATAALFGVAAPAEFSGRDAAPAQFAGATDLSAGVDLSQESTLRLTVDGAPPLDIDCRGKDARLTRLDEIAAHINHAVALALTPRIASHNGRRLILSSPTLGRGSRIAFEPPRATDALPLLLGVTPAEFRGQNAESVRFVGTVELGPTVDLSAGDAVRLGLDGAEPVTVACAAGAADPAAVPPGLIVANLNAALGGNAASFDGRCLQIASPTVGASSQLVFETPDAGDATAALFGIEPPRAYHGHDKTRAEVTGRQDWRHGVDLVFLGIARYLRLGIDGRPLQVVDCRPAETAAPNFATLTEIAAAIDDALGANVAEVVERDGGQYLALRSPTTGQGSRLVVEAHSSGDARALLFGSVPDTTTGEDPQPAVITGEADLLAPADLSRRAGLRLAIDGGLPQDIDVAGYTPGATLLEEVVTAINAALGTADGPAAVAAATAEQRLQLTSPTTGPASRLELLPLRTIDLIEYPAATAALPPRTVRHNQSWPVDNRGALAGMAEVLITAPSGVAGVVLVNETLGRQIRLLTAIGPRQAARIWADGPRLRAEIRPASGPARPVPDRQILVGPPGAQARVPFPGEWGFSGRAGERPTLQLNNPAADGIVRLTARAAAAAGRLALRVADSDVPPAALDAVAADGQTVALPGRVEATGDGPTYRLMGNGGEARAELRAGPGVELERFIDRVVVAHGTIHAAESGALLIADRLEALFRATLTLTTPAGEPVVEEYARVTIGDDPAADNALARAIQTRPSALVRAESLAKIEALSLPLGRSRWRFLDCYAPRFNSARFDRARFPGEVCHERGVFDASRFENAPPEPVAAVFTGIDDPPDADVQVQFTTVYYQPGAFRVELPADLPEVFGGRFNQARFGQGKNRPELYPFVVTEPPGDETHVEKVFDHSRLVEVEIVPRVPLGWEPVAMPFREPRALTLGDVRTQAQLYLTEEGIDGFLRIAAREPGAYGNQIAVSARASGPAMYDFAFIFEGAPFENARRTVLGKPLAVLTTETLKPGPAGVLQAKAAGVHVTVSRERTAQGQALSS